MNLMYLMVVAKVAVVVTLAPAVAMVIVVTLAPVVAMVIVRVTAMDAQEVALAQDVPSCKNYYLMSVRRVVFIITQDCQLDCKYCYLVGKNNYGKMTWETARKIVDFLMSLPEKEDNVVFDFIGGEPLLEIDLIQKISDYVVSELSNRRHLWLRNFSFRFTTNGLLYSNPKVQRYISQYIDRLQIQISLDGTKRKHDLNRIFSSGKGSYDLVIPNVRLWLQQFGDEASVFMVVSHDDLPFLSESIVHQIELGIKDIYMSLVVEDVWEPGDGNIFEKELMKVADYIISHNLCDTVKISSFREVLGECEENNHIFPCGNPMYVFDSGGNIYSCVRFVDFSLRTKPARVIGTIDKGIDYNKLRPLLCYEREDSYPGECMDCKIGACCRWCPAENYDSSDSGTIFQRTNTLCELHKANVRVKNYYWNKASLTK